MKQLLSYLRPKKKQTEQLPPVKPKEQISHTIVPAEYLLRFPHNEILRGGNRVIVIDWFGIAFQNF